MTEVTLIFRKPPVQKRTKEANCIQETGQKNSAGRLANSPADGQGGIPWFGWSFFRVTKRENTDEWQFKGIGWYCCFSAVLSYWQGELATLSLVLIHTNAGCLRWFEHHVVELIGVPAFPSCWCFVMWKNSRLRLVFMFAWFYIYLHSQVFSF